MRIHVSGVAYYAACDPRTSDVPREEGWPVPDSRKVGKGTRFTYEGGRDLAEKVASHLSEVGSTFILNEDDPATRAEGRACLKDAQRIRTELAAR